MMCNNLQQESSRICIYILEYTLHILSVKIVFKRLWQWKVNFWSLSKISLNMTTAKKSCEGKTDKNTKRLCKNYGQFYTDFYRNTWPDSYRKTMPFSEIILNLNFLTILGCGIEVEVLTEAVYTCSKNLIYKMQLSLRYHKVGEESLTAELVNWLRREWAE